MTAGDASSPSAQLTRRQQQVLGLSSEGMTIKDIASILHLSRKTVEFHKTNLMRELGIESTGELIRYAFGTR
jgi:DNA-binding NarL/FixJ family response regulator